MDTQVHFDRHTHQLTGPAGSLAIPPSDQLARHFLMLMEGQCLQQNVAAVAKKFGYCRQRYYQLLKNFQQGGLLALRSQKTGPKSNYRRTDQAVRQILRHLFLDPDASAEVVAQKLRQTRFSISLRSVQRVIADYGLQKKTLRAQPRQKKSASSAGRPKHPKGTAAGSRRPAQRRTRGPSASGR
jgi:transposase